ncbi:MAG: hypothetical protein ACWGNV_13240 [Bacteroidales bacterium]
MKSTKDGMINLIEKLPDRMNLFNLWKKDNSLKNEPLQIASRPVDYAILQQFVRTNGRSSGKDLLHSM